MHEIIHYKYYDFFYPWQIWPKQKAFFIKTILLFGFWKKILRLISPHFKKFCFVTILFVLTKMLCWTAFFKPFLQYHQTIRHNITRNWLYLRSTKDLNPLLAKINSGKSTKLNFYRTHPSLMNLSVNLKFSHTIRNARYIFKKLLFVKLKRRPLSRFIKCITKQPPKTLYNFYKPSADPQFLMYYTHLNFMPLLSYSTPILQQQPLCLIINTEFLLYLIDYWFYRRRNNNRLKLIKFPYIRRFYKLLNNRSSKKRPWPLKSFYNMYELPRTLEIDYLSLSAFNLQISTCTWYSWYGFLLHFYWGHLNMYNWKVFF